MKESMDFPAPLVSGLLRNFLSAIEPLALGAWRGAQLGLQLDQDLTPTAWAALAAGWTQELSTQS